MDQWKGKVALVTGASVGIGAAIAEHFVKAGLIVVGTARRAELIEKLAESLQGEEGRLIARQLDICDEQGIIDTIHWIDSELGGADIVVNNAGIMILTPIPEITLEEINTTFQTNCVGLTLCCREAIQSMKRRGMKNGQIINVNSTLGHTIPNLPGISFGVYPASKFAVTATSELLRSDIATMGYNIRVTSLSPGIVETDLSQTVREKYEGIPTLYPEDVAKCTDFILSMPPHAEIAQLTIQPAPKAT